VKFRHLIMTAALFAWFVTSALAGPPLVCHRFDISNAKSLPWVSHNWKLSGTESYETKNLPADTLAILDNDSTILVHMETLRRAALYGTKDPVALKHLALKLIARSDAAPQNTPAVAMADFDLGYFAEILTQIHWIAKDFANPLQSVDGYALVRKARQLHPNNAQIEFAAALITLEGHVSDHQQYAQAALAGGKNDPLLAQNLSVHFMGPQSETMAEMLARNNALKWRTDEICN
jgi:hypothetical protein